MISLNLLDLNDSVKHREFDMAESMESQAGMMEDWNNGMLGIGLCDPLFHPSSIPTFRLKSLVPCTLGLVPSLYARTD
jgi:hypothetical protein